MILPALLVLTYFAAQLLVVRKPLERADAIFVLSGGSAYIERNDCAATLYHQGRAPKIILTNDGSQGGWSKSEKRNPFYWEFARNELLKKGVPSESIEVLPRTVAGTHDEAVLLRDFVETEKLHSVLLVTSAFHTRRTLWTFDRVLSQYESTQKTEIGIESPQMSDSASLFWWSNRIGWENIGGEYVKSIYYWTYY
ncbi:MAG: YdcF family protein [Pyrinomonadaceae bacterium]|nr:YdcF family protein [Pyrinomonadaceae bacterium]